MGHVDHQNVLAVGKRVGRKCRSASFSGNNWTLSMTTLAGLMQMVSPSTSINLSVWLGSRAGVVKARGVCVCVGVVVCVCV